MRSLSHHIFPKYPDPQFLVQFRLSVGGLPDHGGGLLRLLHPPGPETEGPGDAPLLPGRQPRDRPLLDAAQQEHQALHCQVPREMLAS